MILLPTPRRIELTEGAYTLPPAGYIQLLSTATDLLPAARAIQKALADIAGLHYPIVAGGPDDAVAIDLLLSSQIPHDQGYEMEIESAGVHITAPTPEGAFYAAQTFVQVLRQHPAHLPCLQIEDRPDFRARGLMLDVSRDKVPTMATLFALIDQLAALKVNHLQLYTEHTFAYRAHPAVWAEASPLTGDEILQLDAYCRERFIELVPNQNSFGHMARWLKHPQYCDLAECPDGFTFPWGVRHAGGFTLNPLDPRSIDLIENLYAELLPHFTSPLINVGCDETFDLGLGKSKPQCDRLGKGRVYLDFLLKIHDLAQDHQRIMMFWGDIILNHPELIPQLPRDVVALEWGYEADHPFDDHLEKFAAAGIPVFVCPGTSTWCSLTGRTDNALANLRAAAESGLRHDVAGYLITDWGDYGHHHPLALSFLPYAAGAAYAWSVEANRTLDVPAALDAHVFLDRNRIMGQLAHDLGNVYRVCNKPIPNGSPLFWSLFGGPEHRPRFEHVTDSEYQAAQQATAEIIARLPGAEMTRPAGALIAQEFRFAADLLTHACQRGRHRLNPVQPAPTDLSDLLDRHCHLWLARNRPGGLEDSAARLARTAASV